MADHSVRTAGKTASRTRLLGYATDQFICIPSVNKIKQQMLDNNAQRQEIAWGTADFSGMSAKQVDAIHQVVSSLRYSEAHGGDVCGNILNRVPYDDISNAFAVQILDESHHCQLLTRYINEEMGRPIIRPTAITWLALEQLKRLHDPLICALAGGYFVECAAAEVQHELVKKIDEPLLVQIFRSILRDEARHQALGRESVRFLLNTPAYEKGWKRTRARLYQKFLNSYSRMTLNRYAEFAKLFGIDVQRIHRRTLERVANEISI